MTNMTKKELLAVAKDLEIAGRHDMAKEELEAAVLEAQTENATVEELQVAPKFEEFTGGNYIPTTPFRGRTYEFVARNEAVYATLPPQAKKIFDFMEETRFVGRGKDIVEAAVAAGKLKTTQDAAVLFAFYARKLEDAGLRLQMQ